MPLVGFAVWTGKLPVMMVPHPIGDKPEDTELDEKCEEDNMEDACCVVLVEKLGKAPGAEIRETESKFTTRRLYVGA